MLYLVIPTINGEICGNAVVYNNKYEVCFYVTYECVIYEIDISRLKVNEIDFYDLYNRLKKDSEYKWNIIMNTRKKMVV